MSTRADRHGYRSGDRCRRDASGDGYAASFAIGWLVARTMTDTIVTARANGVLADLARQFATVLETDRLRLRKLCLDDAAFILELLNEPSFLRFIGDKGVRTLDGARDYLMKGPIDSYRRLGFGLYLAELKSDGTPIGMCGLVKRDSLEDVDIGFAYVPRFWGKGYGFEAAAAVTTYAKATIGLPRVVAIASPDNVGSIQVLEKLGLRFQRMVKLAEDGTEVQLFA